MNDVILKLEHVFKKFDEHLVVDDVSLDVYEGEVLCIIGRSGSGKSTLLRMMNLLEAPTSGAIHYQNQNIVNEIMALNHIRQDIGMVFQSFNLFANKSVIENCMLGPIITKRLNRKDAYALAITNLDKVGMTDFANARVNTLSGGQKQRVAIARALSMQPRILLFDEPTSALDPELVGEVLEVMKQLTKSGLTMVIVTHEMSFAKDVADRVAFVDEGKIVEIGSGKQVLMNPQQSRTKQFLNRFHN